MSNIIPNKIIESALVSEKSSLVGQNANTYVFKVNTSATKNQVKKAIEAKFDVNVTKVNILNVKGKTKRMMNLRGKIRKKSDWKKAFFQSDFFLIFPLRFIIRFVFPLTFRMFTFVTFTSNFASIAFFT